MNSRKPSSRPIARAIQVPNNLPLGLGIAVAWYVGLTVIAIFVFCSQSYRASRQEAATEGELGLTKSDIREFEDRGSLLSECIDQVNQVTGLGLSPSLGMAVHSAATYYQTSPEARSELMVLYQPIFWGPLTVFLVLIAFKAHFLTWLGPLRWVFDILEMAVAYLIWPIAGYYVLGTTISELPEGAGAVGGLAGLAMSLYGIVFMYVVLLLNHGIELGILFCPVPLLDTGLKWLRLFVIVYLQLLAYVHPLLGFMAAAPVVCLALYMVPTSLRTVRMGMTFVFDYLLRRWRRWDVAERPIFAFTWGVAGASTLSFGRLRMDADGRIQFEFYPWFFGKSKRIAISPEDCAIGQKTLAPSLITRNPNDTDWHAYLLFPPRFRGHETALAGAVGVAHVQDISMTTSLRKLWQSLRDAFFRVDLQSAEPVAG